MGYEPELWVPKPKIVEVYLISLETIQDIKNRIGATSVNQAYNRNRTILIEWTMMHRETFSGLVGQYIIRNDKGVFEVVDSIELRSDYQPHINEVKAPDVSFNHPKLGRLLAVHETDGAPDKVVFELPDGEAVSFDIVKDVVVESVSDDSENDRKAPIPGPSKNNKEKN